MNNNNGNPPYNPNPTSNVNAGSTKLYKLNGNTGDRSGLGITLKVMTGDVIDIWGKSYYHTNGFINNGYSLTSVLTSFINAFAGTPAVAGSGKDVTGTLLNNSTNTTTGLTNWLQNNVPTPSDRPKAYINWILFDEQFRPVMSNSGFDAVDASSDVLKAHYNTVSITKSGYLYVYCSNESNQDVFFDNLQVIHTRGPLVETNEYYPFGLLASGISYKAAGTLENNYKLSSNELQAGEFATGTGLEFYDFNARMYDAQIGRFMAIDPLADFDNGQSPYNYARNNPIFYTDPSGLEPEEWEEGEGEGETKTVQWRIIYSDPEDEKAERRMEDREYDIRPEGKDEDYNDNSDDVNNSSSEGENKGWPPLRLAWKRLWDGYKKIDRWVGEHGGDWINENINFLTPVLETATGKEFVKGGLGNDKPRLQSGGEVIISFFPGGKLINKGARGLWILTKGGASIIKKHNTWGDIYKSKSDGLWWAVDKSGHGGSKFKVFKERSTGLEWFKDADEFGNFIDDKHKGPTGLFIPWGHLSTVK